jgi:hypothetical protein
MIYLRFVFTFTLYTIVFFLLDFDFHPSTGIINVPYIGRDCIIYLYLQSYSYDIIIKGILVAGSCRVAFIERHLSLLILFIIFTLKSINNNTCVYYSTVYRYIPSASWLKCLFAIEWKECCKGWLSLYVVVICRGLITVFFKIFHFLNLWDIAGMTFSALRLTDDMVHGVNPPDGCIAI